MSQEVESNEEGIKCPHCGKWNKHAECGTYEVMFPLCIYCNCCTEIPKADSNER